MRLGRIAGVRLKVHPLLLLLGLVYYYLGLGMEVLLVLTAVLLHELAHLLVARGMGVTVQEVELLPFGGQAKIEDFTGLDPEREMMVALAGPACSLMVAGFFYFLTPSLAGNKAHLFMQINVMMGLFNLLPVLPLDGGRVLRSLLSRRLGYRKATYRVAWLGRLAGLLLVGGGVYLSLQTWTGMNLLVAGTLLWWYARREGQLLAYSFMRYLVNKKGELSHSGFLPAQQYVSSRDTLVKTILRSSQPTCYLLVVVIDEHHQVQDVVSEAQLIECLFEKGPHAKISDC